MSTNYYRLRGPVTLLRIDDQNSCHTRLSVFIDHGHSGVLVVPTECLREFLKLFIDYSESVMHTHWGGKKVGSVVAVFDDELPDSQPLIDQYGHLLTVGQVKARQGAQREDGMPTELFGYEDES